MCTGSHRCIIFEKPLCCSPGLALSPSILLDCAADPPFPFQFSLLLALTWHFGDERKEIIFLLVKAIFSGHSCLDLLEIKQKEI